MEHYENLKQLLEKQLLLISKENISLAKKAKQSIPLCIKALTELKSIVNKDGFSSKQEEIKFFKEFKPAISSKLLYYIQIFNIESKKPIGPDKIVRKYFTNFLKEINNFNNNNVNFCKYYQSEDIYHDANFFVRNDFNLHLVLEPSTFNYDVTFNTSHDQKVAQIIANEMLTEYLQCQLNIIDRNLFSESNTVPTKKLRWTDNKIALIELMYALHSAKCINSGNIELSEIAAVFEEMFDIELNDYYRKYIEIKGRKGQNTKFLDNLKQVLENRINIESE